MGDDFECYLFDLVCLWIMVFVEWFYLYDGDFDYEYCYLLSYWDNQGVVLVGVFDGD